MMKAKTNKSDVYTYARPSINSIVVHHYTESGVELTIYPSVKGWYELRPVDTDGVMNTEFVQVSDVDY